MRRALIATLSLLAPLAAGADGGRVQIRSENDLLTATEGMESQECMVANSDHPVVLELEGPGHLVVWSRINLPASNARKKRKVKLQVLMNGRRFKTLTQKVNRPQGRYDEVKAMLPSPLKEIGFDVPEGRHVYRFRIKGRNLGVCLGFAFRLPQMASALPALDTPSPTDLGLDDIPLMPIAPIAPAEPAEPPEDEQEAYADTRRPEDRPAPAEIRRKRAAGMPDLPDEGDVSERRRRHRRRAVITVTEPSEEQKRQRAEALRAKRERERRRDETERGAALRAKREREQKLGQRERERLERKRREEAAHRAEMDRRDRARREEAARLAVDLDDDEDLSLKTADDMPLLPDEREVAERRREPTVPPAPPKPPVIDAHIGLTPHAGFFLPLGPGNPTGLVGFEFRWHMPMLRRMVSLGASVNYYLTQRKGVTGGRVPAEYELEMHVLPVQADLTLRLPTGTSVTPYLGGGGAYYYAWAESRAHGGTTTGKGGNFGYLGFAGVAMKLPLGEAGLSVEYGSARVDAGSVCVDCEVGGITVDLSYQFLF